jgi:hypothetical protein
MQNVYARLVTNLFNLFKMHLMIISNFILLSDIMKIKQKPNCTPEPCVPKKCVPKHIPITLEIQPVITMCVDQPKLHLINNSTCNCNHHSPHKPCNYKKNHSEKSKKKHCKHKRSKHKRSKHKRSKHKRSKHKRSKHKRSKHKRSKHKRSKHKRSKCRKTKYKKITKTYKKRYTSK